MENVGDDASTMKQTETDKRKKRNIEELEIEDFEIQQTTGKPKMYTTIIGNISTMTTPSTISATEVKINYTEVVSETTTESTLQNDMGKSKVRLKDTFFSFHFNQCRFVNWERKSLPSVTNSVNNSEQ